jgi:hypothetical protein
VVVVVVVKVHDPSHERLVLVRRFCCRALFISLVRNHNGFLDEMSCVYDSVAMQFAE